MAAILSQPQSFNKAKLLLKPGDQVMYIRIHQQTRPYILLWNNVSFFIKTTGNKFQRFNPPKFKQFHAKNEFENVAYKMDAIM